MDIDPQRAAVDHMGKEAMRQLRGEAAALCPREAAVEIATIGQVPAVRDEAVDIDRRGEDDCPRKHVGGKPRKQALDDRRADDLVAMHRPADEDAGAGPRTMHDAQRQRRIQPGDLLANGNGDRRAGARHDRLVVKAEGFARIVAAHARPPPWKTGARQENSACGGLDLGTVASKDRAGKYRDQRAMRRQSEMAPRLPTHIAFASCAGPVSRPGCAVRRSPRPLRASAAGCSTATASDLRLPAGRARKTCLRPSAHPPSCPSG